MFKRCVNSRKIEARKRRAAGIFPRWITEKINIKEELPRLVKLCRYLEETHSKPIPKDLCPTSVGELSPNSSHYRSGCDESEHMPTPSPDLGLDTLQLCDPKSKSSRPTRRPSRRRKPKSSAKNLKYLGIYDDIRFRSKREPFHVEPVTLGKVSLNFPVGPAQSKILPEELMKYSPEESSDLKTVTLRKVSQEMKVRKDRPTKYDRLIYQPREKVNYEVPPNLVPGETIVVVVRVYWPSYEKPKYIRRRRPPKLSQVIVMLGNQTLDVLRDKIRCTADMILQKECSEDPRNVLEVTAKDAYKSGFFFINDAFYNDFRDPYNIDYSEVIRTWLVQKGLGQFNSYEMESTQMQHLTVQLGYPYVYRHQGSCEHIVVISDIRLLNRSESQYQLDYPYVAYEARCRVKLCFMCGRFPSKWMTLNSSRVPYNPSYFCEKCFYSYNYVDNKKVGNFEAYKFTEPFYFP